MKEQYAECRHKPNIRSKQLRQIIGGKEMIGECSKCSSRIEPVKPRKVKFAMCFLFCVLMVLFGETISIVFTEWKFIYKILLFVAGSALIIYCSIVIVLLLSKWERS